MKAFRLTATILALGALPALTGCGVGEASIAEAPETSTPVPVKVAFPLRANIFATYQATTTLSTEGDAPVLARVPGEVVELLVEEGDYVAEGQALARLDGERLKLEMLAAKADLDMARGEYDRYLDLNRRGLVSEAMFDGLKFDLEALQATYELRSLNYGYATIRATIAGVVSHRNIKVGQNISINNETFRVTDTDQLIAYLQIPQTELAKFAVGNIADLAVDSMPGRRFDAEIIRISPTIDVRNGTFRATARIDNSDADLAPGMFARFSVSYEEHAQALVIPAEALVREDEEAAVFVVKDGEVTRRVIETGIESGDQIEVLDGLGDEEQIVIVGHAALRDGSKVLARLDNPEHFAG